MNWPWQPDRVREGDQVIRCPECTSRHYMNAGILRTEVVRGGRFISLITGSLCICAKCEARFGACDEGVFKLHSQTPSAPQKPQEPPKVVERQAPPILKVRPR